MAALADLRRLTPREVGAIVEAVAGFARHGRGDILKLSGRTGEWRLRQGDWRILLEPQPDGSFLVTAIRNRRDAYDD